MFTGTVRIAALMGDTLHSFDEKEVKAQRMEQALSDVEHGKRGPSEVMDMFHREALRIPADATAIFKADTVTETGNMDARGVGNLPAQLAREGKLADYVNATFGIDAA